ncbi:hypothetical protein H6P81_020334 [Aristolochia fimbriata]|uniref:Uncharacterized protein n=1 Tax=Aristolochia fimbriata TaxID=158543 RepID=A0AAV7DW09_ARIFI|nr:hypothetical protein H6P81_020334 [Aristolochia fimbriata]
MRIGKVKKKKKKQQQQQHCCSGTIRRASTIFFFGRLCKCYHFNDTVLRFSFLQLKNGVGGQLLGCYNMPKNWTLSTTTAPPRPVWEAYLKGGGEWEGEFIIEAMILVSNGSITLAWIY